MRYRYNRNGWRSKKTDYIQGNGNINEAFISYGYEYLFRLVGWRKVGMDESKIRNLEMIQEIINRMANNSFLIKGWSITIAGVLFSLNIESLCESIYFLICFLIVLFWLLDAYYLQLERQYRNLYNCCRKDEIEIFDLQLQKKSKREKTFYYQCLLSKTEVGFYLILIFLLLFVVK